MTNKNILKLLAIFATIIVLLSAYLIVRNSMERTQQRLQEERAILIINHTHARMDVYAQRMMFNFKIMSTGEIIQGNAFWMNMYIYSHIDSSNKLIFVKSEYAAQNFPENVVVAWPSQETLYILDALNEFTKDERWDNFFVNRQHEGDRLNGRLKDLGVDNFNINYPLTVEDLVDNWLDVDHLRVNFLGHNHYWDTLVYETLGNLHPLWVDTRNEQPYEPSNIPGILQPEHIIAELSPAQTLLIQKFNYALSKYFTFQMQTDSTYEHNPIIIQNTINPDSEQFNPFFSEIMLVHSQEDAQNLPKNVIAAWPTSEQAVERYINALNDLINLDKDLDQEVVELVGEDFFNLIASESFDFSQPLAPQDVVDNWQTINALWSALSIEAQAILLMEIYR